MEAIEGFVVLLEKMSICDSCSKMPLGDPFPSQSTTSSQQLQSMVDSALPELYAAVFAANTF